MRLNADHLDHARRVADAILYEGYLLYPYHKEAQKNQVRFQFGVLMPPGYASVDDCEPNSSQTECLLECRDDAEVRVLVRFLQLQRRTVQGVSPETGSCTTWAPCTWTAPSTPHGTRPPSGSSGSPPWSRRCWPRTGTSNSTSAPASQWR